MIARAPESDGDEAVGREDSAARQVGGGARSGTARNQKPVGRRVRRIVSVLLMLHLVAIASAPLAMEPASLPAQKVFGFFRPYLDAAYLNHGYHFFAPEPGPSHLIRYELAFSDGHMENGVFPNPVEQRPRLNYHRHFMLSEFANRLAVNDAQQPVLRELSRSFAKHMIKKRGARSATLFLRRHYIPSPQQVREGIGLDADELYAERPLGTFSLDEVSRLSDTRKQASGEGVIGSGGRPNVPKGQAPAVVRLTGQLYLSGNRETGAVIR